MATDHTHAINAAMKAAGFDPLNHVARKSVEDAVAAYLSERGGWLSLSDLQLAHIKRQEEWAIRFSGWKPHQNDPSLKSRSKVDRSTP